MPDHLEITPHLYDAGFEDGIRETFLGQAHIAGTGPAGKTCRECKFWGVKKAEGVTPPGFYNKRHPDKAGELHRARCHYNIPHKAKRRIPHDAKACRVFDPSDNPPPERRPEE